MKERFGENNMEMVVIFNCFFKEFRTYRMVRTENIDRVAFLSSEFRDIKSGGYIGGFEIKGNK